MAFPLQNAIMTLKWTVECRMPKPRSSKNFLSTILQKKFRLINRGFGQLQCSFNLLQNSCGNFSAQTIFVMIFRSIDARPMLHRLKWNKIKWKSIWFEFCFDAHQCQRNGNANYCNSIYRINSNILPQAVVEKSKQICLAANSVNRKQTKQTEYT